MAWYKPSFKNVAQTTLAPMTLGMDKLLGGGKEATTASSPWGPQQPYLKDIYGQAQNLNTTGAGFNPYTGERYAGLDPLQTQGMGMIQNAATDPNNVGNMAGTSLQNIMQGGAYTPSYLGGAMAQNNAGTPGIQGAMIGPEAQQMQQTAMGNYLGGNSALNDVYNTAARKATETYQQATMPGIRAGAQGAGMGASSRNALAQGQATGMYGQGLQDLAGQIYAPAYENERNRMLQAAQAGQAGQYQGAGMLQAGQENNLQRLLSGANLQSQNNQFNTNAQLQAAQMAPSAANWGAQQLMGLGGINQGMAQQQLTGQQDVFNQQQQAPWQRLQAYQGALGGNVGGTTTQSGTGGGLLGALGGAATGGALGGMMTPAFAAANPWMLPLLMGGGALAGSR